MTWYYLNPHLNLFFLLEIFFHKIYTTWKLQKGGRSTLNFLPAVMGVDPVDKITNLVREIVTKGVTRNNSGTLRSRIPAILGSLCLVLILFFGPFLVFFLRVNFVNFLGFLNFLDFIFGLASRFHLVILLLRKQRVERVLFR